MGYTSHLKLKLSESDIMFMRFSIFHGSETQNPVLAFCDTKSKVLFWDLTRFREYWNALDTLPGGNISSAESQASSSAAEIAPRSHPFLHPFQHRNRAGGAMARLARGESPAESASSNETADSSGTGKKDWVMGRTNWKKRYDLGVSYKPLDPHGEVAIKQLNILGRQVAWSADGKWCVVVSSWSAFVLLERWEGR
jgi:polycomb protein EED